MDTIQENLGIVWCLAFNENRLMAGSNSRVISMWDYADPVSESTFCYSDVKEEASFETESASGKRKAVY